MIVATNTPDMLRLNSPYKVVQLGDCLDGASIIVLMLERNWGSDSIEKIRALTHWVSSYPKEVPCYLIGCESTIPNLDIERYRHHERDNAVRELCDEVLKRSESIGVRGRITFSYLTVMLGYDQSKVEIIYEKGSSDNLARLQEFLKKNRCPAEFEKSAIAFQASPWVLYERPITYKDTIVISRPYVSVSGDTARLSADITVDGEVRTLWCETSSMYSHFLLSERTDAFLCAVLPLAMRIGKNIVCEAPVGEQFLHNLSEILIPQLCSHDPRIYPTSIRADSDSSALIKGNAVATGMSCGVDSLYSVALYRDSQYRSMRLTHLYCGNYLYGNSGPIYERAERVSRDLGLPLICTATNINEALRLPHLFTHFFKTMFGVLALRKLFRTYYYSTAEDFSHFNLKDNSIRDTAQWELLLLYTFSDPDLQIITGGVKSDRLGKTRAITSLPVANKYLNVCLYPSQEKNCGGCAKCMRTLLMLDMLGALERFAEVFDIERYHLNRLDAFTYLARERKSSMLAQVYLHFARVEPRLMGQAEKMINAS